MKDGLLLTSGYATDAIGPNNSPAVGEGLGIPGDPDLFAIAGSPEDESYDDPAHSLLDEMPRAVDEQVTVVRCRTV